ncbi:MAG: ABC transporter permease, partial [Proteobacteria bacterium]|nr:ABC transporter permease [Pseudomonadota bacterium]
MVLWESCLLAQQTIRRNVLRSSLTILGIVIGVAAVITMVTLGSGATAKVTSDISSLGTNILYVMPGQGMRGPGGARTKADPFKTEDAMAIENNIAGLEAVAPTVTAPCRAIRGKTNRTSTVTGVTNAYFIVQGRQLAEGRLFTEGELKAGQCVCILGQTVVKDLFGNDPPTGGSIRLGKISFKVIGTLVEKGQSNFGDDQDDTIVIPLHTLQRRISGDKDVRAIIVSVADNVPSEFIKNDIEELMRERRGIGPGKEDDFHVRDMKEIINTFTSTTTVLTALLSAVAGVSLLVGGIGIMNIMMVSVTERTREIGTRLAIGAMERDVLLQFLVEAVVLAAFGGLIGIILGLAAAAAGSRLIGVPFIFRPGIVAAAFLFSA